MQEAIIFSAVKILVLEITLVQATEYLKKGRSENPQGIKAFV